ncbi:glycosyltransferase [Candidatus Chloroploca asiatica]|uniref:glycosyltransferase n=1 Tax=Candidatus Chloroploca asiatica TaxID=1506545 RepID=UPI001FEAD743|nr:glycosyltransferase [Candidatus Chloroploca asiatica]
MFFFALASGLTILLLVGYWRDWRRVRRQPRFRAPAPLPADAPLVSILIPARNEERAIGRSVAGALAQDYPQFEVVVVDDGSTDGTAARLAELANSKLRVLAGQPLPAGWVGKCNACQQLGETAHGEWLLYLDADTAPAPQLTSVLMRYATAKNLDLVTVLPLLELGTFWERVILPPFLGMITTLYPFERFEDPKVRPEQVFANGPCILIRREAYEAIGGHGAVRNEVLEDVQLAQALRRAGYRLGGGEGFDYLRVRMYNNGREVAEGLMKNAAAGYRSGGRRSGWIALRQFILALGPYWIMGSGAALLALGSDTLGWSIIALGLGSFVASLLLWGWLYRRLYRLSGWYGLLWPLGMMSYLLIAGWGMWRVGSGRGVVWKGRTYTG